MVIFLKNNIFFYLGTPHTIVSEKGSLFYNKVFYAALDKYGVRQHKVDTP